MFKEIFIAVICCILLTILLHMLQRKHSIMLQRILSGVFIAGIILNIVTDFVYVIPEFWYDVKIDGEPRRLKYGDMDKNLIPYTDFFRYPDQILRSVLRKRNILLEKNGEDYYEFLSLYAESVTVETREEEEIRQTIEKIKTADGTVQIELKMIREMEYILDDSDRLRDIYGNERYPVMYIDIDSLKNRKTLLIIEDGNNDLFIQGEESIKRNEEIAHGN